MFTHESESCPWYKKPIFWILLLGLILRLGSVAVNHPSMRWQNDSRMSIPAARMLEGKGFTLTDEAGPTAYRPPLYILWLTMAYAIYGKFSTLGPSLLQMIVSTGNIYLLYLLTKQIWKKESAANAAAILIAIHPYTVYHDAALYHTFLSTALLLGGLTFLFRGIQHKRAGPLFWSGLLFGLVVLIMSTVVPFIGLLILAGIFIWKIPWNSRAILIASFIVGMSLSWGPWVIRNAIVFHEFIPLTTEAGVTLWMGNNPNSEELLKTKEHEASPVPKGTAFNIPSNYSGCAQEDWCVGGISESQENRELKAMAMEWIKANPVKFVKLTIWRLAGIWSPFLTPAKSFSSHEILNWMVKYGYFGWNLLLAALFFIGAKLMRREKKERELIMLCILALSATASYALFLYFTKYRIPFEAVLLPISGIGAATIYSWLRKYLVSKFKLHQAKK
ncbi:MAG: glycosyltransferase family 39 protein [Patescibacteria group bacterium]